MISVPQKKVSADGRVEQLAEPIVCECLLKVFVDDVLWRAFSCTPSNLAELVLGRLLTEGIIRGNSDVERIEVCGREEAVKVFLRKDRQHLGEKEGFMLRPLPRSLWKPEWIFALANAFAEDTRIHRATKGTHSCYHGMEVQCVFHSEDIGRHNAMDKCIGYAVEKELDRRKCMLFTTGRVPEEMAQKAVAAGIPVLASKAVPTDAGVRLAAKYNLTLICKAWPDSYVIFHEAV